MKQLFHIAELIIKEIKSTITPEEKEELDHWINASDENRETYESATNHRNHLDKLSIYQLFKKEDVRKRIKEQISEGKTVELGVRKYLRFAASILIPILLSGAIAYLYFNEPVTDDLTVLDDLVKPGLPKAVLILSNGDAVDLNEEVLAEVIEDGDAKITMDKNTLAYVVDDFVEDISETVYNELKIPFGGQYNLKLADGTSVWLNAGSSLRFPVSFSDSIRQVFLEGEAYFDVTHDGKPFIVSATNMDVTVLGTSFNVAAYSDDPLMKTTLEEGKVQVELAQGVSKILTPGLQAIVSKSNASIDVLEVNAAQYSSWRQGKFEFNNEALKVVMKRLSRWYDFEYEFENTEAMDFHFTARINNNEPVSVILEMLQLTTEVNFEIRGNTVVVL